jgi:hypothetical protein
LAPVLVCRRPPEPVLNGRAGSSGFLVIDMEAQFAGTVVPLDEIRIQLSFADLRAGTGSSMRMRDR